MKNNNKLAAALMLLCAAGAAFGIWYLGADSSYTAHVTSTSDSPVEFSVDLSDLGLDATYGDAQNQTTATISNDNGQLNMSLAITEARTDLDTDACDDYENDCEVTYFLNSQIVADGETVLLESGDNEFISQVNCLQFSCPQEILVEVALTG